MKVVEYKCVEINNSSDIFPKMATEMAAENLILMFLSSAFRLNKLRSLTFAKNNIEKNVKERVLFKNYEERFKRSLHL